MVKTKEIRVPCKSVEELATEVKDGIYDETYFLCMFEDKFFTSKLMLHPTAVRPNCHLGLLYVDFIAMKTIIAIDKLNALLQISVEPD